MNFGRRTHLAVVLALAAVAGARWACAGPRVDNVEAAPQEPGALAPRSSFDFRDGALEQPVDDPPPSVPPR